MDREISNSREGVLVVLLFCSSQTLISFEFCSACFFVRLIFSSFHYDYDLLPFLRSSSWLTRVFFYSVIIFSRSFFFLEVLCLWVTSSDALVVIMMHAFERRRALILACLLQRHLFESFNLWLLHHILVETRVVCIARHGNTLYIQDFVMRETRCYIPVQWLLVSRLNLFFPGSSSFYFSFILSAQKLLKCIIMQTHLMEWLGLEKRLQMEMKVLVIKSLVNLGPFALKGLKSLLWEHHWHQSQGLILPKMFLRTFILCTPPCTRRLLRHHRIAWRSFFPSVRVLTNVPSTSLPLTHLSPKCWLQVKQRTLQSVDRMPWTTHPYVNWRRNPVTTKPPSLSSLLESAVSLSFQLHESWQREFQSSHICLSCLVVLCIIL